MSQDTPEHAQRCEFERPQSCRDHGLVPSLCSAVSSSLARHLPMARRIHAWHDLAVSWRLLQHLESLPLYLDQCNIPDLKIGSICVQCNKTSLGCCDLPCIVVLLLLVQLCAPQRRLGMPGRRDSGPVAGERSGTSALSGHNVGVCAAECLPDTLPMSGCKHTAAHRRPHPQDQTKDMRHSACGNTRQAGCAGRSHPISAANRRMSPNIRGHQNSGPPEFGTKSRARAACQSRSGRRAPFPTTTYARRARKRGTGCMTARRFLADARAWLSDRGAAH